MESRDDKWCKYIRDKNKKQGEKKKWIKEKQ